MGSVCRAEAEQIEQMWSFTAAVVVMEAVIPNHDVLGHRVQVDSICTVVVEERVGDEDLQRLQSMG